ncbi:MAG: NB-ARC domain-containing protein (plasmid) [Candidatus Methanoperedens sp.]|uniref:NB-ARC domain-containing protein n=1 Tax=Candidatus Methanoperedens sp. BLZ2 TaxID=2035255 RepID=UPI000BE44C0E|nr:NB-ARC domain-containing protein [Candidatus Methanoperedens sp. BLZ2]KAB2946442.1 MAG: TIR domain-containing protein [Candidatus Methanoperedens sp.]MBZ0175678.1 TIR domain-containing protein [Candidatus Methanoperedens nitroreducens]WAH95052.1 MAG: NB-ARC domain-containing protein [Candidatus Methanoperedens sp.]WAM22226.1 MAG: NB-ARC domain-containing protein [Candidatus Methanoperedens sp.]
MNSIFLSYARGDDEPFVRHLYKDLTANGFAVWYDRTDMPSRALTFHKEIRDAIDSSGRLIVVIGPKAIQSDYVRAEWQHALSACKIVIPIIRSGKRDLLPIELRKLNSPDMRESRPYADALADLLRVLGYPVVPLGELRGVPSLPAHFLPRPEFMEHLKNTVLADVNHPIVITSAKKTTALQGMGGIGKSVLVAAFARACETRHAFRDGVVWLTLGQQPDIARNMMAVGQAFNDDLKEYIDIESGKARIAKVLADKNCLLVLDDIWDVRHAEAFLNALGTRCRLLITTRDGGLATSLGAQEHRLDVLSIEDAMRLLTSYSGQCMNEMSAEANDVVKECGYLPFALALCGAMVSEGTPWNDLLESLRQADLSFLMKQFPNYPYPDVLKSLKVSVDALARTDPAWEKHYKELAVFPHSEAVPEETVIMFWISTNGVNERSARQLLITLERKSLIKLEGKSPGRRVSMHDLQHDYLRAVLGDLTGLHGELLEIYRQKSPEGWHTGPNDGYFFQRLVYHMVQAGKKDEVSALLFDFYWMLTKLKATDVFELMADYDTAQKILSAYVDGKDRALRLVQGALRLSAHVLAEDKSQLPSQMTGRLLTFEYPEIKALLVQMKQWKGAPWLRPMMPNLTPPGGPLLRTIEGCSPRINAVAVTADGRRAIAVSGPYNETMKEARNRSVSHDNILKVWDVETGEILKIMVHSSKVKAVAVTADGRLAISGSDDKTLKVWDIETGEILNTLEGHSSSIKAVALTADGHRAISGSDDKMLKVWDIETGEILNTLEGHSSPVNAIAVTADGHRAISGSDDKTLKMWDIETGKLLKTLEGHSSPVNAVAVTADGHRAISGSSDNTLKVWNLETGEILNTLEGHSSYVYAVTVTADGRLAISGSLDNTLKVWDIETGKLLNTLEGHSSPVNAVAVTADGRLAISGSSDNTLKVWNFETGKMPNALECHSKLVEAVVVTADGRRVISASDDKTLKVWDIKTGKLLNTLEGHFGIVFAVSVTADGRLAISASFDETLKVWNLDTGKVLNTFKCHSDIFKAIVLTPDGMLAITGSLDRTLKIWDIVTGNVIHTLEGHSGIISAVVVTPDGRLAISASFDGTLKAWNLETMNVMHTLKGHYSIVSAVALTPDGKLAISGSYDETLKVWDLETGKLLNTFEGHSGFINAVTVTIDGRCAISASDDKTLKVWDMENGEIIANFKGESPITTSNISSDGVTIVAGEKYGKMLFLRMENVLGVPIVSAWYSNPPLWQFWRQNTSFPCPFCRTWSEIPASALGTEIPCPHCRKSVRLNPFTINADWRQVAKAWQRGKA